MIAAASQTEGTQMIEQLISEIASHGDRGAVVPFSRINDLKDNMTVLQDGEFHTDWINRMARHVTNEANKFIPPDTCFEPQSMISVVIPSKKAVFQFNYHGELIVCTVPPVETAFTQNNARVLQYLSDYLLPQGFSAVKAVSLPHKMLATHCGLGSYGRNNIFFSKEFGSYVQLMTFLTNLPCDEANWIPLNRMESCEECTKCVSSCPTGAIDPERQLINSDRCVTYFNERLEEFPKWLDKSAHSCLVGCMHCQDCCPENEKNKDNIRVGVSFSEEETRAILDTKSDERYPEALAAKLELALLMPEFNVPAVLSRNLAALLQSLQA